MQTYDVIIIGAGPAGVATARALAKVSPGLAARTLLLEQRPTSPLTALTEPPVAAPSPRVPLTGAALRALEALDLGADISGDPITAVCFEDHARQRVVPLATPWRLVSRAALSARMFHPVASSLEVRLGEQVKSVEHQGEWVRVETQQRSYRAHVVIGADGARSAVRALMGWSADALSHMDDDSGTITLADATLSPLAPLAPLTPHATLTTGTLRFDLAPAAAGSGGLVWYTASDPRRPSALVSDPTSDPASDPTSDPTDPTGSTDPTGGVGGGATAHVGLIQHTLRDPRHQDPTPPLSAPSGDALLRGWLDRRGWLDAAHVCDAPDRRYRYSEVLPIGASRLLLVGDAAGVVPLLDDGLWQCLEYGCFAAYALTDAFERRDFNMQRYGVALQRAALGRALHNTQRMCARLFGPDRAHWLRRLLRPHGGLAPLLTAQASGDTTFDDHSARLILMRLMTKLRGGRWV